MERRLVARARAVAAPVVQALSVLRWMLTGLAAVLVIGGYARDAGAANVCNAALDSMFLRGPNFVVPGDATRDTVQREPDGALGWGDGESHPVELPFRGLRELLPAAMMRV